MVDFGTLLAVAFAFWVIAAPPGPANLSNAAIAMRHGRRASLPYGACLMVALCVLGLLAATGMGAVVQASATLMAVLKVLGGLYLLCLAWQSARLASHRCTPKAAEISPGRWFMRGVILNLANPKSVIAWMAALSMGLNPDDAGGAVLVTTLTCMCVAFFNNFNYAMLFSVARMMTLYLRCQRWIDGVGAALFALGGRALTRSAFAR